MTDKPVTLLPLVCLRCTAPVPANPGEVAWVCGTCGQGLLLNESAGPGDKPLRPLEVRFSTGVRPGQTGRPFWVAQGQADISRRDTYKGNEQRAASQFWAAPRPVFIPAWECALDEVLALGSALLKNPPALQPGSPCPFLPVVTAPEDIHALAEFLVVALEAERRDALKYLGFTLRLGPPELWILE